MNPGRRRYGGGKFNFKSRSKARVEAISQLILITPNPRDRVRPRNISPARKIIFAYDIRRVCSFHAEGIRIVTSDLGFSSPSFSLD